MKTETSVKTDFMEYDYESGKLVLTLQNFDGSRLLNLQKALLLGIEEIGYSKNSGADDYRDAIWNLTCLLRGMMLNESQTNVALGGKPFRDKA